MSRAVIILNHQGDRAKAAQWASVAPEGTRVEFKRAKRTLSQNDKMWAMLTDFAEQLEWHGMKLIPDDWKLFFLNALDREMRMIPNIDENGFVPLGKSSSSLTPSEMHDMITIMEMFGAKHGVKFGDEKEAA